jgi:hypothetical protein
MRRPVAHWHPADLRLAHPASCATARDEHRSVLS